MASEKLLQACCKVPDLVIHFTKGNVVTGVFQFVIATKGWTARVVAAMYIRNINTLVCKCIL